MEEEQDIQTTVNDVISSLEEIGKAAVRQKFQVAANDSISTLKDIGIEAVNQGFEIVTKNVIYSLRDICKDAIKNEFEIAIDNTIFSIQDIALTIINREFTYVSSFEFTESKNDTVTSMEYAVQSFEIIVKTSVLQNFKPALEIIARSLLNISSHAIKKDRSWLITPIIIILRDIGREIAGDGLKGSVDISVLPLMEIGTEILKRELANEARDKDISLDYITDSLVEIAKVTIIHNKKSDTDLVIWKLLGLANFMFDPINKDINSGKFEHVEGLLQKYIVINVLELSSSLGSIGVMCSQNKLIGSVNFAILFIRDLGSQLLDWRKKIENSEYELERPLSFIIFELETIGTVAAEEKFEIAIKDVLESLAKLREEAISKKCEEIVIKTITSLEHIGTEIFQLKEIGSLSNSIFSNLENVVDNLIDQKMESLIIEVILYLNKIAKYLVLKDLVEETYKVTNLLEIIGCKASLNKLEQATITSINVIHEIGLISIKENIIIQKILNSLFLISKNTISEELVKSTNEITHTLNDIGKAALKEKQREIGIKAKEYLEDIFYDIFVEHIQNIPEVDLLDFKFTTACYIKELKECIEKSPN